MSLRIGYKASAEQFGPRELVELGVLAEQRGFDSVVVSDHYQPWRHEGGHAPFSLAWMSAVGERTERVLLGTSVLTPTFRYQPAVIAQAFATMGCLFPGRVMLGVGTGEAMNEVAVTGVEWPAFKERFGRLRESVRLMRALWEGERVSFEGDYYRPSRRRSTTAPSTPIPIYIAAGGPQVARYAGRAGDGFICTSGKGMELYEEKLLPAVAEGLEKNEREPDSIDRMIEIKLSYDTDPERALENTRFWAPLALTADQKAGLEDPIEMGRAGDALPIEQVASRWIVASDPDDAIAKIKPYVDLGFTHLVFHAPGEDQPRFLDAFDEQLAPAAAGAQRSSLNWWARVHGPPGSGSGSGSSSSPPPPSSGSGIQPRHVATMTAPRIATSIPASVATAKASSSVSDGSSETSTAASPGTGQQRARRPSRDGGCGGGSAARRAAAPGRPPGAPRRPPARRRSPA